MGLRVITCAAPRIPVIDKLRIQKTLRRPGPLIAYNPRIKESLFHIASAKAPHLDFTIQDQMELGNGKPSVDPDDPPTRFDLSDVPSYRDLPSVPNMPHGCTWGLWDKLLDLPASSPDELGTLNWLTPDTMMAARDEIRLGVSVALNWRMDNCQTPHSGRRAPEHRIFTLEQGGGEWTGHDDEVHYNTQGGSQWDGFSS